MTERTEKCRSLEAGVCRTKVVGLPRPAWQLPYKKIEEIQAIRAVEAYIARGVPFAFFGAVAVRIRRRNDHYRFILRIGRCLMRIRSDGNEVWVEDSLRFENID